MSAPELKRLLSELRDGPVALSSATEVAGRRERLLPAVRANVRDVPQRRRTRRTRRLTAVVAMAACGVLGLGAASFLKRAPEPMASTLVSVEHSGPGHSTVTSSDGRKLHLMATAQVAEDGTISVPAAARARLRTSQGIAVELAESTRAGLAGLRSVRGNSSLRLLEGSAHFEVPPLARGSRFSVLTLDAEVTVHGTEFDVGLMGPRTCVRVSEGRVSVRRGAKVVLLGPGESSGCEAQATALDTQDGQARSVAASPARRPSRLRPRTVAEAEQKEVAPTGTLADETRLLSAALSAERRGDKGAARRLYGTLLNQYPNSPLAPEARTALGRIK